MLWPYTAYGRSAAAAIARASSATSIPGGSSTRASRPGRAAGRTWILGASASPQPRQAIVDPPA